MKNINTFINSNPKNSSYIMFIILISILIFGAYILKLRALIDTPTNMDFSKSEFIRFFNSVFALLAVLSCLVTYLSNKKKELFLMSLVYIIFLIDILVSNINSLQSNNISAYIAVGTTLLRIGIAFIAISNLENIKTIIVENSFKSICILVLITLLVIAIEYSYNTTQIISNKNFYLIYNLGSFILYLFVAIIFFKKSILEYEYIYGLLATSMLMFSTKSIYAIVYQFASNEEIRLTSVSITYIGFIILIIGLLIELSLNINKNKILENQNALFFNIVEESMYSNIIICDENYTILHFNKKALQSIKKGYLNSQNLLNNKIYINDNKLSLSDIFKENLVYSLIDEGLIKNGYYNKEIQIEEDLFIDISTQLFEKDNLKYKVVFFRDISEKYKMQSTLLENEIIKKEEKMKKEFFANISHELKTPLTIIYSTVQLLNSNLNKNNFKEVYIKHKNSVDINCKRIIRLIDNIVDSTKLETGFKSPKFINYDIVKLTEDITLSIIKYAKVKNINVIFDTEIEELCIKCDPDMIERLMLNLLSNSIKYTKSEGTILVYLSITTENFVSIKVKDDGIGIPNYIQDRIYDRFVQGDKSFTRQNEGSGIGLSIVKSIVKLLGGNINFKSDKENGTEFEILLPIDTLSKYEKEKSVDIYHEIDTQRIQLEFSDIYEIYETI